MSWLACSPMPLIPVLISQLNVTRGFCTTSQFCLMPSSHHRHGQDKTVLFCLVRIGGVNWTGDKTRQFCLVSKCGVNRVLSCLDPASILQLFSLQHIEDYRELSCLVATSVHTADTDNTRQSCLVCVSSVNYLGLVWLVKSSTQVNHWNCCSGVSTIQMPL